MARKNKPPVDGLGPFFLNDGPPTKTATARDRDRSAIGLREKAVRDVVRPGGDVRGKQKSDAADKWRKPAAALAEEIWRESPGLRTATVSNE
jgi:hypothetical protein